MKDRRYDQLLTDPELVERAARIGRLCNTPGYRLGPLRTPLAEHIRRAPAWLKAQVAPLTPLEERLWALLNDPGRLGTEAVAKVPIYVPELEAGYVVDFLLPAYSVAVMIEPSPGMAEDGPDDEVERLRIEALWTLQDDLQEEDIETLGYYPEWIEEDPGLVIDDIRLELGLA